MRKTKLISIILALSIVFSITGSASTFGGYYLPDVRSEMSSPSYWAEKTDLLMTYEEIEKFNAEVIHTNGTNMYDLKNQPDFVDGVALNEAVMKSTQADARYYLGWTYLENNQKATQDDYNKIIENTRNPDAQKEQKVLYGIATKRTELRTFPSSVAIWDDPADADLDYQYLVAVRVNEPVVITSKSKDGKYYLAKSICCSGWIPADSVAICKDKNEWLSAWDINSSNALVVWGDRVYTESSVTGAVTSDLMLTMGTVLELAKDINPNELIDNRSAYNNYVVYIPVRNGDGSYSKKLTLISEHKKVSAGYLPLNEKNISKVAFSALGNTYGWGGGLNSDDCSGYMRNVYKCFGMELARNTTWQTSMPTAKVDMQYMSKEERIKFFEALPFGTILYFNGHEMMYLGSENGKYYVISAAGSIMQPENPLVRQRIRSTVVNTLDVKRTNGNTWFDELTVALVPFFASANNPLPEYEWYHDGVAFCLKNKFMQGDENKFFNPHQNITWAEFLQILYNMEKTKAESPDGSPWYTAAVEWAHNNNLIYENDKNFNPESAISREQLASVLYLYSKFKGYNVSVGKETNILSYDDALTISEYAVPAMQYVVGSGIISGKTKSTLNPADSATRAEIAVVLSRYVENRTYFNYKFADAQKGKELLLGNTKYLENLTRADLEYKLQKKDATKEEYIEFIQSKVLEFNDEEKNLLTESMQQIEDIAEKQGYKLPETNTINFVKTTMEEEGGVAAYTHNSDIYIGEGFLKEFLQVSESEKIYYVGTILHELFHCFTRNNPDFRKSMYEIIGFTVAEKEFEISPGVKDRIISNPDVGRHDSYATFTINGEKRDCYVVFLTTKDFDPQGGSFFEFASTHLVPIDSPDTVYTEEEATDFWEVFGRNTSYVIDPEECLADNFAYAFLSAEEEFLDAAWPNPEIIEKILNLIQLDVK